MLKTLKLLKLSSKLSLKGPRASYKQKPVSRDSHGQNIWEKLQFSSEIAHYWKNSISIFKDSFAGVEDWGGRLGTSL